MLLQFCKCPLHFLLRSLTFDSTPVLYLFKNSLKVKKDLCKIAQLDLTLVVFSITAGASSIRNIGMYFGITPWLKKKLAFTYRALLTRGPKMSMWMWLEKMGPRVGLWWAEWVSREVLWLEERIRWSDASWHSLTGIQRQEWAPLTNNSSHDISVSAG